MVKTKGQKMVTVRKTNTGVSITHDELLVFAEGKDLESAMDNFINNLFKEYDSADISEKYKIKRLMSDMMFDGLYYAYTAD